MTTVLADLVNGWYDHGVCEGGTTFGDDQVCEDIERRYSRQLPDGTWGLVIEAYAVMEANEEAPRYYVDERTTFIHCRDRYDPDGTEIHTDFDRVGGALLYALPEYALQEARRLADGDNRDFLFWG